MLREVHAVVSCLLPALLVAPYLGAEDEEIRVERVIGPEFPGPYKHPASIAELANGDLYIAYYGGEGEYQGDTAVFGLRRPAATGRWTPPRKIADTPFRSEGNAVIWQAPPSEASSRQVSRAHKATGDVWLFYVCRYGETWSTSRVKAKVSRDGAFTWSDSFLVSLQEGFMVQGRPEPLAGGDFLLPVYDERGDDREAVVATSNSLVLRYDAKTHAFTEGGRIRHPNGNIQPALARLSDGRLVAYCRRGGGYGPEDRGYVVRSESRDDGKTWTPGKDSQFPNPNAAVAFLRLESGSLLLVYNDSMTQRSPLRAALSSDEDRSYPRQRNIMEGEGPFAYPYMVQAKDGRVLLVFTSHDRSVINLASFREGAIVNVDGAAPEESE